MKILKPAENCLEKTTNKKVSVNSRLKAIYIIRQRKALYNQIIEILAVQGKKQVFINVLNKNRLQNINFNIKDLHRRNFLFGGKVHEDPDRSNRKTKP